MDTPPAPAEAPFGVSNIETVRTWCTARSHPLVTYNRQFNVTLCRCAERQEASERPVDWEAKRQVFHSCPPGAAPCDCYTRQSTPA